MAEKEWHKPLKDLSWILICKIAIFIKTHILVQIYNYFAKHLVLSSVVSFFMFIGYENLIKNKQNQPYNSREKFVHLSYNLQSNENVVRECQNIFQNQYFCFASKVNIIDAKNEYGHPIKIGRMLSLLGYTKTQTGYAFTDLTGNNYKNQDSIQYSPNLVEMMEKRGSMEEICEFHYVEDLLKIEPVGIFTSFRKPHYWQKQIGNFNVKIEALFICVIKDSKGEIMGLQNLSLAVPIPANLNEKDFIEFSKKDARHLENKAISDLSKIVNDEAIKTKKML
jgi:hypothetical protein